MFIGKVKIYKILNLFSVTLQTCVTNVRGNTNTPTRRNIKVGNLRIKVVSEDTSEVLKIEIYLKNIKDGEEGFFIVTKAEVFIS